MYIYLHLNEYKQQCNTTYSGEISQIAVFKKLTFLNLVTESFFPMSMKTRYLTLNSIYNRMSAS